MGLAASLTKNTIHHCYMCIQPLSLITSVMDRRWVAVHVRCEASGASEATPAVAEASEATCNTT